MSVDRFRSVYGETEKLLIRKPILKIGYIYGKNAYNVRIIIHVLLQFSIAGLLFSFFFFFLIQIFEHVGT